MKLKNTLLLLYFIFLGLAIFAPQISVLLTSDSSELNQPIPCLVEHVCVSIDGKESWNNCDVRNETTVEHIPAGLLESPNTETYKLPIKFTSGGKLNWAVLDFGTSDENIALTSPSQEFLIEKFLGNWDSIIYPYLNNPRRNYLPTQLYVASFNWPNATGIELNLRAVVRTQTEMIYMMRHVRVDKIPIRGGFSYEFRSSDFLITQIIRRLKHTWTSEELEVFYTEGPRTAKTSTALSLSNSTRIALAIKALATSLFNDDWTQYHKGLWLALETLIGPQELPEHDTECAMAKLAGVKCNGD